MQVSRLRFGATLQVDKSVPPEVNIRDAIRQVRPQLRQLPDHLELRYTATQRQRRVAQEIDVVQMPESRYKGWLGFLSKLRKGEHVIQHELEFGEDATGFLTKVVTDLAKQYPANK